MDYDSFKKECIKEIQQLEEDVSLKEITKNWFTKANNLKYSYHFEFLGRPIIQYPQDMVAMQELIWQIKPDLVIETGIAHGGSLIMSASMLSLLDYCDAVENSEIIDPNKPKRKVLGIDIDIRANNREAIETHPMFHRIDMIEGSSIAPDVVDLVYAMTKNYKNIMVCLDSMHTHDHVLTELEAYAPLVNKGSYCVIFDTIIEDLPVDMFPNRPWGKGNNPKTAVLEYLKILNKESRYDRSGNKLEFETDKLIENKLQITVAPDGYLKRI